MKKYLAGVMGGLLLSATSMAAEQHMVDMADSLNAEQFYQSSNPDSLWSSALNMPWAKQSAVNVYDDPYPQTTGAEVHEGGNRYAPGKLINVRAEFNAQTAQYEGSSAWAGQALHWQMAEICPAGYQRIAEWVEPVGQSQWWLYFQFTCIAPAG